MRRAAAHQMNDIQMSVLAGVSSHSDRTASEIVVNGLASANCWSPSGIDSAGTNTDDANVSGKISVKPIEFAVSGDDERSIFHARTLARRRLGLHQGYP